ncbi:MAG: SBBP repeat-containing protein [Deltaproteobacteria bacterium]|nr:SBBP repeat-containing protein [Deltaproteobacteria bacterium]
MEYDILVKKGGDPSQVRFQYSGIENFEVTNQGDLSISLKDGGRVIQKKPVIYQETEGNRNYLTGKFRLHQLPFTPDNLQSAAQKSTLIKRFVYSFEVASYNKDISLIIDPVLVYSTYLGGRGDDAIYCGQHIAVDSDGNVYIAGSTESDDFPTKAPLYPDLWGQWNSFVTKINSTGTELIFSTYIGGSGKDTIKDIAIDSSGNIYITGDTYSDDFPTKNALYPHLFGGKDGFVTKINAAGDSLIFSTYLGGKGTESGKGIALDSDK